MRRAPRLAHRDRPVSLARHLEAMKGDPGVDERGHPRLGVDVARVARAGPRRAREQRGDPPGLEVVDQAGHHRADLAVIADGGEVGDGIEDDERGVKLLDGLVGREQVGLEAEARRARRDDAQTLFLHQGGQVEPDGAHVADQLFGRLLEGEEERATVAGGRARQARGDARLARPGRARDHDARAAVEAAAQHLVELAVAARDPLAGGPVNELHRRHGEQRDAAVADEKRVLVDAVPGAAVLDHAQPPGRDLLLHPQIEENDAVGDVLLEPVAGEGLVAALAGDDGRDALALQPAKEPVQLGAQQVLVGERAEENLGGVDEDAAGADGVDGQPEPDEEAVEAVVARLRDGGGVDGHVVDDELFLRDEPRQIEAERGDVGRQLARALLEAEDGPRLAELRRAAHEKLEPEDRLSAARAAADQRGPTARQPARGELVEAGDARRRLGHGRSRTMPGGYGRVGLAVPWALHRVRAGKAGHVPSAWTARKWAKVSSGRCPRLVRAARGSRRGRAAAHYA